MEPVKIDCFVHSTGAVAHIAKAVSLEGFLPEEVPCFNVEEVASAEACATGQQTLEDVVDAVHKDEIEQCHHGNHTADVNCLTLSVLCLPNGESDAKHCGNYAKENAAA